MKANKKLIITAISTLVIGLLFGWLIFGTSSEKLANEEHQQTIDAGEETIWTCSMHPQIRQNEPGKCPICGMDLIPLESQEGELDPMAISMSPTAMQLANVSTALVGTMDPVKSVRLNGKVQADERLVYSQSSHVPGRIEKLMINFTGEFVNKGQPIAYIYSPDLATAQEELFEAYKIRETQPQLYNSVREKLKNWKLTDSQIDRIIQTDNPREEFPVMADVSGYVTKKMVNLGDYIQRGTAIYEIADLSKVWVLFDVYESDMPWIKKGDKINFTIASLPAETFSGRITFLDPLIDPKTRVAKARVEVSNAGLILKPEMFASGTVEAKLAKKSNNLVIPKTAVMWTGERSVVYVKSTSDIGVSFKMRNVTLGPALGESFIIESGLEKDEEIAVNGTFSIDAAAQLAGKPSMMNPEDAVSAIQVSTEKFLEGNAYDFRDQTPAAFREQLNAVIEAYLELKDGLVVGNEKATAKYSTELFNSLQKVNGDLLKGEAKAFWEEKKSFLMQHAKLCKEAPTIDGKRENFIYLSEPLIKLVVAFGPGTEKLYVDYCSMANNNKGAYWLSKTKEIRNPFMAEAMRSCGEVKQEVQSN